MANIPNADFSVVQRPQLVWTVLDENRESTTTSVRVCASRAKALEVAREIVNEYRNDSSLEDEIDEVLLDLETAAEGDSEGFGAGDGNAVFYVSVEACEVEG